MRRRTTLLSSSIALALIGSLACSEPQRPSVVLITLDTTRVDHVSAYGYERTTTPNLDALAGRAVRFTHAWSTSSWTLPAHASLFTGLYPSRHGARFDAQGEAVLGERVRLPIARFVRAGKLPDEATTLAEILSEHGYRTGAFVAGPWLHRSFGLLQGFAAQDDNVSSFAGRPAEQITDRAIAWLGGLGEREPYFLFVNYFDAHAPYRPPVGYDDLPLAREPEPDVEGLVSGERALAPADRAIFIDRYDGEIRYMDHHLGRLLRAVESAPGGSGTLILVTADHGEAFGEGGRFGHTFWLSEELLRVPFIVRYPDGRSAGQVDASPVQLVDVLPLLAAELGFELPDGIEGTLPGARRAAFAEVYREPTTLLRFGEQFDRDLRAVIQWPHKLIRSSRGEQRLERLDRDAAAQDARDGPAVIRELAKLLDEHERAAPDADVAPAQADPRTLEALRHLGYIE